MATIPSATSSPGLMRVVRASMALKTRRAPAAVASTGPVSLAASPKGPEIELPSRSGYDLVLAFGCDPRHRGLVRSSLGSCLAPVGQAGGRRWGHERACPLPRGHGSSTSNCGHKFTMCSPWRLGDHQWPRSLCWTSYALARNRETVAIDALGESDILILRWAPATLIVAGLFQFLLRTDL